MSGFLKILEPVYEICGMGSHVYAAKEEFFTTLSAILLTGWTSVQEKELPLNSVQSVILTVHSFVHSSNFLKMDKVHKHFPFSILKSCLANLEIQKANVKATTPVVAVGSSREDDLVN